LDKATFRSDQNCGQTWTHAVFEVPQAKYNMQVKQIIFIFGDMKRVNNIFWQNAYNYKSVAKCESLKQVDVF